MCRYTEITHVELITLFLKYSSGFSGSILMKVSYLVLFTKEHQTAFFFNKTTFH